LSDRSLKGGHARSHGIQSPCAGREDCGGNTDKDLKRHAVVSHLVFSGFSDLVGSLYLTVERDIEVVGTVGGVGQDG